MHVNLLQLPQCDCAQARSAVSLRQHVCRDVASGSKRITEVNEAFHSSAETLEQQAKTYGVSLIPYQLARTAGTSDPAQCVYCHAILCYVAAGAWCNLPAHSGCRAALASLMPWA